MWARLSHAAKVSAVSHILQTKNLYRPIRPYHPLTHQHLSRRGTLVASTQDVVKHAAPELLDNTDLLLNRLLHGRGHEVRDGVKIDAVGVAVVRIRHGKDNGEGRGADDFGFGDDLMDLISLMFSCV